MQMDLPKLPAKPAKLKVFIKSTDKCVISLYVKQLSTRCFNVQYYHSAKKKEKKEGQRKDAKKGIDVRYYHSRSILIISPFAKCSLYTENATNFVPQLSANNGRAKITQFSFEILHYSMYEYPL